MEPIRMVDLSAQYAHIQEEIDQSVLEIIRSTQFINGPAVRNFQASLENYLDSKHVIPCANGTDALQIALMGLGLKPGDEVITATFTYVATAEVIALLGLRPVLVDVDPDTFMLDPKAVEAAITPKTKAIVPVHLFGQCADMEAIMTLAETHHLFVVEDTAQAIGADFIYKNGSKKKAGTIGHVGCTSFFPSKNLGCYGDGGAIFCQDDELAARMRMIANHGQSRQYYHDVIGVNSRLDSIQAAVLQVKLPHLDRYNASRRAAADYYDHRFEGISSIKTPVRASHSTHVFHQYTLQLGENVQRDTLRDFLATKDIPAMIYYPVPLHQQKAYRDSRYNDGHFPIAEKLAKCVLSLPMHSELEKDQQDYICGHLIEFLK